MSSFGKNMHAKKGAHLKKGVERVEEKKNVFLDLDNTLISAEALEDFPFKKSGIREKAMKFAIHDMDGYYIIFERPNVQSFLDWLFKNFNVSVWTAASKDYALYIIEHIVLKRPDRKLDFILFSHHCDISKKKYKYSKQLKLVFDVFQLEGYNKNNTVIVDDLPEVKECQPKNCIAVEPFEILNEGSEHDDELTKVKEELKKE